MATRTSSERPRKERARNEAFGHPIEFLFAEHDRQLVVCAALDRLAGDCATADARDNAAFALGYLERELPLHIADEEESLFPLLKRRADPDDDIDALLAILNDEHDTDHEYHRKLLEPLRAIAAGRASADAVAFAHMARAFSVFQRRHLAWENGTILPLARKRLTAADQAAMGDAMAGRRGAPVVG